MENVDIKIVGTEDGDWYALYINDVCYTQGHSITAHDIFRALNLNVKHFRISSEHEIVNTGRLLNNFKDYKEGDLND